MLRLHTRMKVDQVGRRGVREYILLLATTTQGSVSAGR